MFHEITRTEEEQLSIAKARGFGSWDELKASYQVRLQPKLLALFADRSP